MNATPVWRLELEGTRLTLEFLARQLTGPELRVVAQGDRYYLTGRAVNSRTTAIQIVSRLNGVASLYEGYVAVDPGVMERIENGRRRVSGKPRRIIAQKTISDEAPDGFPSLDEMLRITAEDQYVEFVLSQIADPNWVQLFMAFEAVIIDWLGKDSSKTREELAALSGQELETIKNFGDSAQRFRHAINSRRVKEPWSESGGTMTLQEAIAFIKVIVAAWLKQRKIPELRTADTDAPK